MKIDYSPRASGRTTRMIEWLSKDERRVLITYSHNEENRLKRAYPQVSNRIVDWESWIRARKTRGGFFDKEFIKLGVDNADYILEKVLGEFVDLATFTKEEVSLREATSVLGSIKTEKKAKSSRLNGKKGGRPKKAV